MAQVLKSVRLVNPGIKRKNYGTKFGRTWSRYKPTVAQRKASNTKYKRSQNPGTRKMSLAQKLHFGTKRQRAAAQASLKGKRKNPAKKRGYQGVGFNRKHKRAKSPAQAAYYGRNHVRRTHKRTPLKNVGEIITIRPLPLTNSGRKRKRLSNSNMATRRRRRAVGSKVRYHRRRRTSNPGVRRVHRRRRSNPTMRTRTVVRYRNRGRRMTHRRRSYRRNAGAISTGNFGTALNIVGGALVTKFIVDMLPSGISQGIPGYIASAVIATSQGKAIGKLLKNASMGNQMAIGGYVYTTLKIANDLMPSLSLPFKLNGMGGVYGPSSFYVPQVNRYGSMANFVAPSAIGPAMVPGGGGGAMRGLSARRMGRQS